MYGESCGDSSADTFRQVDRQEETRISSPGLLEMTDEPENTVIRWMLLKFAYVNLT